MDFYAEKSRDLPRFVYRNFLETLGSAANGDERQAALRKCIDFVKSIQARGDWLKLKWCTPPSVAKALSAEELSEFAQALTARRGRRNEKFLEVFPHCADEFSYEIDFLDAAFGSDRYPLISRTTKVFTIGSCFARNIANYLKGNGYDVTPFQQAEDLNSPFSNAKMLAISAARPLLRHSYVERWVNALYPPDYSAKFEEIARQEVERLEMLAEMAQESDVIIVTCGNVLDYFMSTETAKEEPGPLVAPKFFSISASEDIDLRQYLTQRLKQTGSVFRMGSSSETGAALRSQHESLRALNPDAHLVYTLSPVPIDSAIGISGPLSAGAVELDCISKSTLRVALSEIMALGKEDPKLHYFPSFEIVRWIAPCVRGAIFGNEDAASRHVSQAVLTGVYRYFLHKFCAG